MKKLMFSAALLAGIIFASCSDDDSGSNDNCVPCALEMADEVCEGDNGNAFVDGMDTQTNFDDFVADWCEEDQTPVGDCVTCAASDTMPATVEICEGENGNAIVMGQDMGLDYQQYVDQYEQTANTTCE